jgi:hypothetical protein
VAPERLSNTHLPNVTSHHSPRENGCSIRFKTGSRSPRRQCLRMQIMDSVARFVEEVNDTMVTVDE